MRLSAPIFHLKRQAKLLARQQNIPLHEALRRIALQEGYKDWSLLVAKQPTPSSADTLFANLEPGDLLLLGARPGQGKTLKSIELAVDAMKAGHRAVFFTLEYTKRDVVDRFSTIGADYAQFAGLFTFDCSDAISADYIIEALAAAPRGTLVIVDYLQLLDQKRDKPDLAVQVHALKSFARDRGLIIVFISQIDRSYDASEKPCPDIGDVRLPNPLDMHLFNKTCFLNKGDVQFQAAS
jgi:replicative DNA helicase